MKSYRHSSPLLTNEQFLTDGGLETTLIFHQEHDLPEFAAFDIIRRPGGYQLLIDYYETYIKIARKNQVGFILESPTWRASRDWGRKLGYNSKDLKEINCRAIGLLEDLRNKWSSETGKLVISGNIGPRGDGYVTHQAMTVDEARSYHSEQIQTFSRTTADLVSAFTINYVEEAIGITLAAQDADIPVVISFTLETNGRLPSGQSLGSAISTVDWVTGDGPAYYMINCAHPTHFKDVLAGSEPWLNRIRAIRANASTLSHAELDVMEELDDGDPAELGRQYGELKEQLPNLTIFGGCCGTDHRHIDAIYQTVGHHTHHH